MNVTIAANTHSQQKIIAVLIIAIFSFCAKTALANSTDSDTAALVGRWDITLHKADKTYPSWLEVQLSGYRTLVGQFVSTSGSARPISLIRFLDGKLSFSIPPQWEQGTNNLMVEGTLQDGKLNGTLTSPDGTTFTWTAVRSPNLTRTAAPNWQKPVRLFNGKNLSGWHATGNNQWIVKDGILQSPHSGANLVTDEAFTDFKLHIEFRYPKESNSGVYLRGRYEVQIEDAHGDEPYKDVFSSIYGFIAPSEMVAKAAGDWQAYDITLGRKNGNNCGKWQNGYL